MRVCILGRGKVGRTLQRELERAEVHSTLVRGRGEQLPTRRADVYLLAVPDAQIGGLALTLLPALRPGAVVLHCAGARDIEDLSSLRDRGVHVGVFHPLLSFADATTHVSLRGATIMSFGDPAAVAAARKLGKRLHARVVVLAQAPGPAYHAAAALVANGAAALAQLGAQLLTQVGFEQTTAERALAALLASVAENVRLVGVPAALTGPVMRGDHVTLAAHLAALAKLDRKLARAYASVQPVILASARAAGLDEELAQQLERTLMNARIK